MAPVVVRVVVQKITVAPVQAVAQRRIVVLARVLAEAGRRTAAEVLAGEGGLTLHESAGILL